MMKRGVDRRLDTAVIAKMGCLGRTKVMSSLSHVGLAASSPVPDQRVSAPGQFTHRHQEVGPLTGKLEKLGILKNRHLFLLVGAPLARTRFRRSDREKHRARGPNRE